MEEQSIFKVSEVEGQTIFKVDEIINIAKRTIDSMEVEYELADFKVLYEKVFDVTNEPAWNVAIIAIGHKKLFQDAFEFLMISDITGEPLYIMNDHGVLHEIRYKR